MHYKQNNKESKTYVQGLRLFGNTLPRGIKGILKKNGYNYSEIINKWKMLVGRDISSCCYPKTIKTIKGNINVILILSVERGEEITVEYSKTEIINKINSHFGYKFINEIRLQTFNSIAKKESHKNILKKDSKKFKEKISKIKNKKIRDSLAEFLDAAKQ